jgi:hypothetical protein
MDYRTYLTTILKIYNSKIIFVLSHINQIDIHEHKQYNDILMYLMQFIDGLNNYNIDNNDRLNFIRNQIFTRMKLLYTSDDPYLLLLVLTRDFNEYNINKIGYTSSKNAMNNTFKDIKYTIDNNIINTVTRDNFYLFLKRSILIITIHAQILYNVLNIPITISDDFNMFNAINNIN